MRKSGKPSQVTLLGPPRLYALRHDARPHPGKNSSQGIHGTQRLGRTESMRGAESMLLRCLSDESHRHSPTRLPRSRLRGIHACSRSAGRSRKRFRLVYGVRVLCPRLRPQLVDDNETSVPIGPILISPLPCRIADQQRFDVARDAGPGSRCRGCAKTDVCPLSRTSSLLRFRRATGFGPQRTVLGGLCGLAPGFVEGGEAFEDVSGIVGRRSRLCSHGRVASD